MITHVTARAFCIWDVENLAPHYRLTLDHWSDRFERVVPAVLEKSDEAICGNVAAVLGSGGRRFSGKNG